MKRAICVLWAGIVLLAGLPAFSQAQAAQPQSAQAQGYPKEAYVKNVPLVRIYIHPLGYKCVYLKGNMQIGEIYVPLSWFNLGVTSKAEISYGPTSDRPYVSISWVDGKFERIVINASSDMAGPTWGTLSPAVDLAAQFNVQEPPREF
ncbi:MAG TPA: hypothetical protein VMV03_16140 [Spirochaetia bacterium]|nr:hypothetical protein [Spirochaetia bacterium]